MCVVRWYNTMTLCVWPVLVHHSVVVNPCRPTEGRGCGALQPGNLEKPLIKDFRSLTQRGPASEAASIARYVNFDGVEATPNLPLIHGKQVKSVKTLMDEHTDVLPVWIM